MKQVLKSALLGSKLKILLTGLLSVVVVVTAGFTLGFLGTPSVVGVQNSFGDVTQDTTQIRSELVVNNPNPIGVTLGGVTVSYDVRMNDVEMANGSKQGVSIGTGNSTLLFDTTMDNQRIAPWWVSHIRNDERTTVSIDARVRSGTLGRTFQAPPVTRSVNTDLISSFNSSEERPIDANQPVVSDPVAYVNETSATWGEVTRSETPIDMRMDVYNAKSTPLVVSQIGYNVTMNGVPVGSGTTDREYVIEGHTTETVRAGTEIQNERLDDWWVSHLQNDQVTQLRIDFWAQVEVAGDTFRIPLDQLTHEETIRTDIFGTKNSTASGPDGTTTETEGTSDDGTTGSDGTSGDETTVPDGTTTDGSSGDATTDDGSGATTNEDGTTTDDGLLARSPVVMG